MQQINSKRLMETLETLGCMGESTEGMQRLAFTPTDVEARRYVIDLLARAEVKTRGSSLITLSSYAVVEG